MDNIMTEHECENLAAVLQQEPWYEKEFTLESAMEMIRGNLIAAVRNYVAVGFYLKAIRDRKLYEEAGYLSFEDFVRDHFDKDKTWASRCIKVNDKLSKDGNTPILDDQYRQYNVSQLVELSYMTEEQRQQASPDMTVGQLRDMRRPQREIPYFEIEGQLDLTTDFPEVVPEPMEQVRPEERTFMMNVADLIGDDMGPEEVTGAVATVATEQECKETIEPDEKAETNTVRLEIQPEAQTSGISMTDLVDDIPLTDLDLLKEMLEQEVSIWQETKVIFEEGSEFYRKVRIRAAALACMFEKMDMEIRNRN